MVSENFVVLSRELLYAPAQLAPSAPAPDPAQYINEQNCQKVEFVIVYIKLL
jgi:hypothetical protein